MQRDRNPANYQDIELNYEERPSLLDRAIRN